MITLNGRPISIYKIRSYMTYNPGRISNYSVDFNNETIDITYELNMDDHKDYGPYLKLVNNALHQVFENYRFHRKDNDIIELYNGRQVPLLFLDEIQYIGILYIDKIETKAKEDMPKLYSTQYNEKDIEEDFRRIGGLLKEHGMWNFDNNRQLPFNLNPEMSQKMPYVSILQLLGLFNRFEHKIIICEENIKETLNKMKSYNPKLNMNLDKFIELVLLHELGHSVFQYVFDNGPIINETRANYFSSYITKGKHDPFIDELTQIQPLIYCFPVLSIFYMYVKQHSPYSLYEEIQRKYNDLVGALYEI